MNNWYIGHLLLSINVSKDWLNWDKCSFRWEKWNCKANSNLFQSRKKLKKEIGSDKPKLSLLPISNKRSKKNSWKDSKQEYIRISTITTQRHLRSWSTNKDKRRMKNKMKNRRRDNHSKSMLRWIVNQSKNSSKKDMKLMIFEIYLSRPIK